MAFLTQNQADMKEKVLIFDDDADILEVCSIVLQTNDFEVTTQANCEDILEKISRYTPDVLLMDNKIPPSGGIAACRTIRGSAEYAGLPIVFFSANQDVARLAAEAGADHFIEKPFDLDTLVSTLRNAITARTAAR
jgi:DNA-binding response OmpR family regulator